MALDVAQLNEWMSASFPVRQGNIEMVFVESLLQEENFRVVMRLFVWEGESIRDIKEQELYFCSKQEAEPPERVHALVQAWEAVLEDVLASLGEKVDYMMPHDLGVGDALRLARSQTKEDFVAALRKKSRLGKYLPS